MKKKLLENFISKYNLSGAVEAIKWKASQGKLAVHFAADGIGMIGFIDTTEIPLTDGEYNIYKTAQLSKLISVLGDDITFTVRQDHGKATAFNLTDGLSAVTLALSDAGSVPVVPLPKNNIPAWDVEFKIDAKFRDAFVRGKTALSEVEKFVVKADTGKVEVVIGYEPDLNTHRVVIAPDGSMANSMKPVYFMAAYFKDILMANKEMPDTTAQVSTKGVLTVRFTSPEFTAEYYLFQKLS